MGMFVLRVNLLLTSGPAPSGILPRKNDRMKVISTIGIVTRNARLTEPVNDNSMLLWTGLGRLETLLTEVTVSRLVLPSRVVILVGRPPSSLAVNRVAYMVLNIVALKDLLTSWKNAAASAVVLSRPRLMPPRIVTIRIRTILLSLALRMKVESYMN